MTNFDLVKKFRPIFVFSKTEKYYPVSKKFLRDNSQDSKNINIRDQVFDSVPYPQEPLYYHILDENAEELAVAYIIIFPYSTDGFFGLIGRKGDVASCVLVINKNTKTLKEVHFWNGGGIKYDIKTTRPTIFVSANDHKFIKELDKNNRGLRWEPDTLEDFNLKLMKTKKIEGKDFDYFLKAYE